MSVRLRTKLALTLLLPVITLLAIAGWFLHHSARRSLQDELGRNLASIAGTVAASYNSGRNACAIGRLQVVPDEPERVRLRFNEQLESTREALDLRRVFVFRPGDLSSVLDTDRTVGPGSELFEVEADRAELARLTEGEAVRVSSVLFEADDDTRYMNGYAPVYCDGELIAVVGAAGAASFFTTLDSFRTALLLTGGLLIVLIVLASVFFSHRLTRPIGRLVDALRRFGRGELHEDVALETGDEIEFLADAFNDMRRSLDRRDEQMQLMLSGIAHEVRNPLAGMELFCSLLIDELKAAPEQRELVEKIERELDYLSRVVNDFLRYARRRPLSSEHFKASDMLRDVVEATRRLAGEGGVTVTVNVPDDLQLTGEQEAIRGILQNLTQNAIQACAAGDSVTITASEVGDARVLEIVDTGCGISAEKVDKIFEPFFTTRQKGTGLGLALVHKTVRDHEGDIEVESVEGEGTTMRLTLPFDDRLRQLTHEPDYDAGDHGIEMIG